MPNWEKRNSNAENTSRNVLIMETWFTTESVVKTQQIEQIFNNSRYYVFQNKTHGVTGDELSKNENILNKEDESLRSFKSTLFDKTKMHYLSSARSSVLLPINRNQNLDYYLIVFA